VKAKSAAPKRSVGGPYRTAPRATARQAGFQQARNMQFFYLYILQSQSSPEHFYTGRTEDLRARLAKHNAGEVPHTANFKPWQIKTAIAFTDEKRAIEFERYLKSASGRAFAKKHL
jgi:predicted GIY-YIG superfamily endonuclease